jgi:Polyketide cyclase / dehydrase and lipid transport
MARYVVTVQTEKSASFAFAYMADLRNFESWDPGVRRVTQVEGSGGGMNASFDVVVVSAGREQTLRYVTTEFNRPDSVVIEARSRTLTSIDRITVKPGAGAGCLVTYDAELLLNGPLRFADCLLKPVFRRIGDRAAAGLVKALAGEVVD